MDICIKNKDHAPDGRGLSYSLSGLEEKMQQALIRLTVRRGAFPLDKTLGSRLYTLRRMDSSAMEEQAFRLIQEALEGVDGLSLQSVKGAFIGIDTVQIEAEFRYEQTSAAVTITI